MTKNVPLIKMEARPIQPDDYALLTSGGKSQTYLIRNISPDGIYISPLIDPGQRILLTSTPEGWKVQGHLLDHKIEFFHKKDPPLIFTGTPDLDIQILNHLDDGALNLACQTNKYAADLCRKDELWERRTAKYFPEEELRKPVGVPWKSYYYSLWKEKGKFYTVIEVDFRNWRVGQIGAYRTKKSAAEKIFEDYYEMFGDDPEIEVTDTETFRTEEGNLTRTEFIQHLVDKGNIRIPPDHVYRIFWYHEVDIKP